MRNRNLACSNISTSNIREQLAILLTYLLTPLILKNSEGKRSGGMDFVLLCTERSDVRNNIFPYQLRWWKILGRVWGWMYGRQVVAAPGPVVWNHRVPANHWSRLRRSALIRHTIRRHIIHPQDLMWTCWVIPQPWMDIPQDRLFSNSTILTEAWGLLSDLSVYPVANRKRFSRQSYSCTRTFILSMITERKSDDSIKSIRTWSRVRRSWMIEF